MSTGSIMRFPGPRSARWLAFEREALLNDALESCLPPDVSLEALLDRLLDRQS